MSELWTLPGESIPEREPRAVKQLIGAFFGMLALANVAALVGMTLQQTNFGYEVVQLKFSLADTVSEPVDWVFIGDSTCNQGISPRRFEELTGETALNLCTIGNLTVVGDAWVLERLIDNVGQPRRGVLLSHAYDVWMRDADGLGLIAAETDSSFEWRQSRALRPATFEELAQVAVGQYVPLVTRPESMHLLLYHLIRPAPVRHFDALGFMDAGAATPDRVVRDVAGHLAQEDDDFQLSDINRQALIAVDDIADVPVFIVPAPMAGSLWAHDEIHRRVSDANAGVNEVASSRPGMQVVREEPWLYRDDQMHNADHIDGPTALLHTDAVVAALRGAEAFAP